MLLQPVSASCGDWGSATVEILPHGVAAKFRHDMRLLHSYGPRFASAFSGGRESLDPLARCTRRA